MKKAISILLSVSLLLALTVVVQAKRPKGLDDRGPLTKITFIHYKRGQAKPPWAGGGGNGKGEVKCFNFLAKGAKWKNTEDYYVNATGSGMASTDVLVDVNAGVSEWETYGGSGIFGTGSLSNSHGYNDGDLDGVNTASFGVYPNSGVIAVANVWGYFGGPPRTRELVEWDILFNTDGNWIWGDAAGDGSLMDLQNIATHELGHSGGLGDLYETTCTLETMYGYSSTGDIDKRDLHDGDIQGITDLYK